jgi:predicted transcriptional regulator
MHIEIHDAVYRRLCEVSHAQRKTSAQIIQEALVIALGMEGMPLEEIYGNDGNAKISKPVVEK